MIGCRYGQFSGLTESIVADQRTMIVGGNELFELIVHLYGPIKARVGFVPIQYAQVVHHVTAADNEHTFFTQGFDLTGELVVILRSFGVIDALLEHGYVGIRIHAAHY